VADPASEGRRVEVGAEEHALGAEAPDEDLDEVEVVRQARVEAEGRASLGDARSLLRGLEGRERVEHQHLDVGERRRQPSDLPERFVDRFGHGVEDGHELEARHAVDVAGDPGIVHGHALEPGVEADAVQAQLLLDPIELVE
jgi:hypothetical protein